MGEEVAAHVVGEVLGGGGHGVEVCSGDLADIECVLQRWCIETEIVALGDVMPVATVATGGLGHSELGRFCCTDRGECPQSSVGTYLNGVEPSAKPVSRCEHLDHAVPIEGVEIDLQHAQVIGSGGPTPIHGRSGLEDRHVVLHWLMLEQRRESVMAW